MSDDSLSNKNQTEKISNQIVAEYKELNYLGAIICQYIDDLNNNLIFISEQDKKEANGLAFLGFQNAEKILRALIHLKDRWTSISKEMTSKNM